MLVLEISVHDDIHSPQFVDFLTFGYWKKKITPHFPIDSLSLLLLVELVRQAL